MIKYEVNEAKRTVVAHFDEDTRKRLSNFCRELAELFGDYNIKNGKFVEMGICGEYNLAKKIQKGFGKFVGKAKCHPDDTFNVEKGKLVARDRLLYKWRRYKSEIISCIIDDMSNAHDIILEKLLKKTGM